MRACTWLCMNICDCMLLCCACEHAAAILMCYRASTLPRYPCAVSINTDLDKVSRLEIIFVVLQIHRVVPFKQGVIQSEMDIRSLPNGLRQVTCRDNAFRLTKTRLWRCTTQFNVTEPSWHTRFRGTKQFCPFHLDSVLSFSSTVHRKAIRLILWSVGHSIHCNNQDADTGNW